MSAQLSTDPLCYWVLLTETLHLCYTSPSFNAVVPNWRLILGRRFLDYLNPKANAPETIAGRLRKVFNDEEDNGAIIYCQYATVRAIRHHLDTTHFYPDQDDFTFTKYSFVASRAGGFLLVFLHIKTESSKDCGFDLCEPLKSGDLSTVTQYLPPLDSQPPYHVFQILSDDEQRHIIFSTPTTLPGRVTIVPSSLAEGTQSPRESWTNHFDTSCTNRTKASFMINTLEGNLLNVSCIIVRHGHAFLVMYRLTPFQQQPPPASSPTEVRYMPPPGPPVPYNTHSHAEYRRLSLTSEYSQPSPIQQTGVLSSLSQPNGQPYSPVSSSQLARGSSYLSDSSYPPTSPEETRSAVPHSPIPIRHRSRAGSIRRHSYATEHPESPGGQTVGPSRTPMNNDQKGYFHGVHSQPALQSPTDPSFMQGNNHVSTSLPEHSDMAANNLRGKPAKDPPKGVTCCRSCHTTVTPEWRKGPTGVKDMCNACGLRWNRRVKKFKGEGANLAETFETLIPGEGSLEPQRSGGGSKKGHRKKAAEIRGPALTTRPPKRRHSDANMMDHSGINSHSVPEDFSMLRSGGTQDSQYQNTQPHHPHNPHYSQESPNRNSRPHLAPLFDDQSSYPPPPALPMSQQTPLSSGVSFSTQADSPLKSPQTPNSPAPVMGFYQDNVDEGGPSGGGRKHSLVHPYRPSTSLTNGTRDQSNTPLLPAAHIYHPAQDLHHHSHSPELVRQAPEPQMVPGPNGLASRR